MGANDVANAMETSVGSGAISVASAIVIAAIFEFSGAVLAAGHVTGTNRKGIIDATYVTEPEILVYGMVAALLAAGVWLMTASYFGWPVSTTHIIVGAVLGVGMARGIAAIDVRVVAGIVASWIVTLPIGATLAALSFLVFKAVFA